jgi:hypothetical protein
MNFLPSIVASAVALAYGMMDERTKNTEIEIYSVFDKHNAI